MQSSIFPPSHGVAFPLASQLLVQILAYVPACPLALLLNAVVVLASRCTLVAVGGGRQVVPPATLGRATLADCMCGVGSVCRRKRTHIRWRRKVLAESDHACHYCACGCSSNCCCQWWSCVPPASPACFGVPCGGRRFGGGRVRWSKRNVELANSMTAKRRRREASRGSEMKAPCPQPKQAPPLPVRYVCRECVIIVKRVVVVGSVSWRAGQQRRIRRRSVAFSIARSSSTQSSTRRQPGG